MSGLREVKYILFKRRREDRASGRVGGAAPTIGRADIDVESNFDSS